MPLKLSLSSDFGSPRHWERVIDFGLKHGVTRLVFWSDIVQTRSFKAPLIYPNYPGLLPDEQRIGVDRMREHFRRVAEMAANYRSPGLTALLREKDEAVAETQRLLDRVRRSAARLKPEHRDFLVGQFEDLAFYARVYRLLTEAQAHDFLTRKRKKLDGFPTPARFKELVGELENLTQAWEQRYPDGRYKLAEILREDWLGPWKENREITVSKELYFKL